MNGMTIVKCCLLIAISAWVAAKIFGLTIVDGNIRFIYDKS